MTLPPPHPRDPSETDLSTIYVLQGMLGAMHRLAWDGPDEHGDRRVIEGWFRLFLPSLVPGERALATVLDWWLAAALGKEECGLAWNIAREVPGPVGEVLFDILKRGGPRPLDHVRRPVAFRDTLKEIEASLQLSPNKIAAANYILTQAMAECRALFRAAEDGLPPPRDLRLASATEEDLEAWANTTDPSARTVNPNTPVWGYVVRELTERARLVRRALDLWPAPGDHPPTLPPEWEPAVQAAIGLGMHVAKPLLQDAVPDPGERILLSAHRIFADAYDEQKPDARLFTLIREAVASTAEPWPAWVRETHDTLARLQAEVTDRRGRYVGQAAQALDEVEKALGLRVIDDARQWLETAAEAHRAAEEAAEARRQRGRSSPKFAALARLGYPVPDPDAPDWAQTTDRTFKSVLNALSQEHAVLHRRSKLLRGAPGSEDLQRFNRAHQQQDLDAMFAARDRAREAIDAAEAAERGRLGDDLWAVRADAAAQPLDVRGHIDDAIVRAVARREAGLSSALADDLSELVRALKAGGTAPAIGVREGGQMSRLAWVHGAVPATGKTSEKVTEVRGAVVSASAAARVAAWGEIVRQPGGPDRDGLFRAVGDTIEGPYRAVSGHLVPMHPAGIVAQAPAARFIALFGRVTIRSGPDLVPYPPTFAELCAVGGTIIDCLDDEAIAAWLADALRGVPTAEALHAWLGAHTGGDVPPEVRHSRLQQIDNLLPTARALAPLRDQALAAWLASEAGARALAEAADRRVDVEGEAFRAAVQARQADLRAALDAEAAALAAARASIAEESAGLDAALTDARAELAAITELIDDRKLRLLAQLTALSAVRSAPPPDPTAAPTVAPSASPSAASADEPLRAAPFRSGASPDLPTLVKLVAGDTWSDLDVANLLLSIATGRWTLLAGLPGVGKSTFARSVLSRIGHGPATDRYLELVVRRDWQEDAALFGFWHPTQARWTASSEGFIEHLLRAADGAPSDGLWPVLIEELNLASPEYYLARVLSAFEAADPAVRLYGPDLRPANGQRYPSLVRVPEAVRMIGTVNVDDTVERLSPRFLSRTSVLWVEPRHDAPTWRLDDDYTDLAVPFSALADLAARPAPEDAIIARLVRFLHDQRVPGAPTARTQRAIGRYLAAAQGTLPADDARDLQVVQRILPPLRGVGPRWRKLLDELTKELKQHGLRRSAERTQELRERGEELGDWYDFFHT